MSALLQNENWKCSKRNKIKRRLRNIMNDAVKTINMNLNYSYLFIAKKNMYDANYKMIKDTIFRDLTQSKMIKKITIYIIKIYKLFLSPILGPSCRYLPTCSDYFIECLNEYGVIKGSIKGTKRITILPSNWW